MPNPKAETTPRLAALGSDEHEVPALRKAFAAVGDDLWIFKLERDGAGQARVQRI